MGTTTFSCIRGGNNFPVTVVRAQSAYFTVGGRLTKPSRPDDLFGEARQFVEARTIRHYTDVLYAPLVIGKDRWSYIDVARRTGLPPGHAARLVSAVALAHRAKSIRDFYHGSSPASVAIERFGERAFLLLLRIFQSEGFDVVAWARRGPLWQRDGHDNFSSFTTYKRREARANAATRTHQRKHRPRGYAAPALDKEGARTHGSTRATH